MDLSILECPIYSEHDSKLYDGPCSTYPTSCMDIPCGYHSIGDLVYDSGRSIIYRIKSLERYGNCHIPIFVIEPIEPSDVDTTHTSTACYLTKAVDENDISFYGLAVKAK